MTDASGRASGSSGGKAAPVRRRPSLRRSLDADEFINMMHGSDPIRVELTRLENQVRGANVAWSIAFLALICFLGYAWSFGCESIADKNRELGEAQAEIKSLKLSERAREKAHEEVLLSFLIVQIGLHVTC